MKTNNTNVTRATPPPPVAQRPTTASQQDPSLIAKQQKLALQVCQTSIDNIHRVCTTYIAFIK